MVCSPGWELYSISKFFPSSRGIQSSIRHTWHALGTSERRLCPGTLPPWSSEEERSWVYSQEEEMGSRNKKEWQTRQWNWPQRHDKKQKQIQGEHWQTAQSLPWPMTELQRLVQWVNLQTSAELPEAEESLGPLIPQIPRELDHPTTTSFLPRVPEKTSGPAPWGNFSSPFNKGS